MEAVGEVLLQREVLARVAVRETVICVVMVRCAS